MADRALDWLIMRVFPGFLLALLAGAVTCGVIALYCGIAAGNNPTMTLYKNEWPCSAWAPVEHTYYINVNNIMIPQTSTTNECIEYRKASQ